MNLKKILGLLTLILSLNSCQKEDVIYVPLNGPGIANKELIGKEIKDPENNVLKDFNRPETKSTMTPIWVEGDLVTVYSIDEDDKIVFIDTCAVYDVGNVRFHKGQNNYARITAEVAAECKGYFSSYPFNLFDYKVGDVIDFPADRNFGGEIDLTKLTFDGSFGLASIMTSWCNWCDEDVDGRFDYHNRAALFQINNVQAGDLPITVSVENGINVTVSETSETTLYFPITVSAGRKSKVTVNYKGIYSSVTTPKAAYQIGHVYPFNIEKVRLTTIYIEGKSPMKPSMPAARFYCWGVIGGDHNQKVDLSAKATWELKPSTSGKILYNTPGQIWFIKEAASVSSTLTATFEGFTAKFTIANK